MLAVLVAGQQRSVRSLCGPPRSETIETSKMGPEDIIGAYNLALLQPHTLYSVCKKTGPLCLALYMRPGLLPGR